MEDIFFLELKVESGKLKILVMMYPEAIESIMKD